MNKVVKGNVWTFVKLRIRKIFRWWLVSSTIASNELLKLELSGLGNPQIEDELIALVSNKDPKIVFLMETKLKKISMEIIGLRMQLNNIFVVPWINRGSGLALLWREDITLDIQTYFDCHIDAFINHGVDDTWWFMGFYGDLDTTSQEDS